MTKEWVQCGIGIVLILSPWMFGAGRSLIGWADVILGIVLVLLNVWTIFGRKEDDALAPSP